MKIRILHVVTYMGRGGLETMIMNYYRRMDRTKVQFDFLVHRDFRADYDDEIEQLGGRIYRIGRLIPWSRAYQQSLDTFFAEHPEYREVHVHQDCLSAVILKAAMKHGVPMRIAHSHSSSQDKNLKYYKMQKFTAPRMARFCKCSVNQLPYATEDENIMEGQAIGIAPRILMPKATFIEAASQYDIVYGKDNWQAIYGLADLFDVSKQSVMIRLEECNLL